MQLRVLRIWDYRQKSVSHISSNMFYVLCVCVCALTMNKMYVTDNMYVHIVVLVFLTPRCQLRSSALLDLNKMRYPLSLGFWKEQHSILEQIKYSSSLSAERGLSLLFPVPGQKQDAAISPDHCMGCGAHGSWFLSLKAQSQKRLRPQAWPQVGRSHSPLHASIPPISLPRVSQSRSVDD